MTKKALTCLSAATMIMLSAFSCVAQHLVGSTEIEKNIAGLHYGASLSVESKRKFSVGAYYQCGVTQAEGRLTPIRSFYAIQVQLAIMTCDKIAIQLNTRTGFINDRFLVFVPAVLTTVQLSPSLGLSIGSGLRMQNATMIARVNITL